MMTVLCTLTLFIKKGTFKMKKIELLAPAGDLLKLKIAVLYGADAVFIGGHRFSLRSRASNFTIDDIREGCTFAHKHGSKIHVTCNIVMHENDTARLVEYLTELELAGVDAVIASSLVILQAVTKNTKMEAHVSTQNSVLNTSAVNFFAKHVKAKRVVLARELGLLEIEEIIKNTDIEIEAFIHGGMCVSYSGRCVLSNNMTNRDANRGGCAHSCRWNYSLFMDDKQVNPDNRYFNMGSKDLSAVEYITRMIDIGVSSLKIEGRMKSIHYVASVVKTYRDIIDEYTTTNKIDNYEIYHNSLKACENRLTSKGFLDGMAKKSEQLYDMRSEIPTKEFVGIVLDFDKLTMTAKVEERDFFKSDSLLEILSPNMKPLQFVISEIINEKGESVDAARHAQEIVYIKSPFVLSRYDMIRLKK